MFLPTDGSMCDNATEIRNTTNPGRTNMTVNEMRDLLEDMIENGYGEREVLFVYQQNYPLQDHIAGGWVPGHDADPDGGPEDETNENAVYLVSAGQCYDQPYGPSQAFDEVCESL